MFIPRRYRPSVRQGFVRLRGLFALTLMMGMVAVLAGCGSVPGMGASSTCSLVGLWLLAVSTLGLLVGCGGPSLNASQSRDFPPTVAAAPTPTPAVPTAVALKFVQQPTKGSANAQAGSVITPSPQVEAVDQNGNRITTFTDPVTITLNAPPGVTLLGTATRNAVAGVATFDDLRVSLAGSSYTLHAASGTLQASTSVQFTALPLALSFAAQQTFAVGGFPAPVAVGDFNLDDKSDLVIANQSRCVSVLLGNGDGTFQGQQTFTVGVNPLSVAVGDFNGDGKPDLAIANYQDITVSVLLGNGDGSFQTQQTFAVGKYPNSVAVGDFNGDKKPDLATANYRISTVSLLLGNGDGTFQTQQTFAVGASPLSVAVGDLNLDGKPDLVTANSTQNTVSVLLGNGDGTFQGQQTFTGGVAPLSVAVGDLNLDGKPDLVTANSTKNTVSVLLGNGDGTFQTQQTFAVGANPYSMTVTIGDFNLDGKPDLATVNREDNNVSVLLHD